MEDAISISSDSDGSHSPSRRRARSDSDSDSPPHAPTKPSASETASPASADVVLTPEQRDAIQLIMTGRSVLITGGAGTGKSFLLKEIIRRLPADETFVTASTGVAAINIGGNTVHSWAGIGMPDPETPFNDSLSSVLRRRQARERWHRCKTLIIDEVSMIDGTMLDRLEFVARALKQTTRAFGGIQLILCGDFLQLPPVTRNGAGLRCFQSACWGGLNLQPLVLSVVKRQDDDSFSALLNRIRRGIVDHRDISALNAPKSYDATKRYVRLFSTNDEVQRLNAASFEQLQSPVAQYDAIDSGEPSQLETLRKSVPAAQRLSLRVGAQVILLKNISVAKGLANGTTGTVVSFVRLRDADIEARDMLVAKRLFVEGGVFAEPMLPVVDFSSRTPGAPPTRMAIVPDAFNLEEQERILASRVQIPLALAWAMTIHKSQGMTLPAVEADLGRCFEVGQAYVALSRAVCIDTLVVRGLTARSIRTCPLAVAFYESIEAEAQRRAALQASQSE